MPMYRYARVVMCMYAIVHIDNQLIPWSCFNNGTWKLPYHALIRPELDIYNLTVWHETIIPFIKYTGFETPSGERCSRVMFQLR